MKQKLKTILKSAWWILILTFITIFLFKNLNTVTAVLDRLPLSAIGLAFSAIIVAKFLLVFVMYLALQRYRVGLSFQRCFNIYNITQLGKYIPGSIWQFVGRISLYREHNISNDKIRDTLLLETFWVVFSAFFIGISLILLVQQELILKLFDRLPALLTQPVTIIALTCLLLFFGLLWRKTLLHYARQFMFSLKAIGVVSVLWICLGFSFWITLLPNTSLEISLTYIIGLYALSYALGFVVPFAPAGIGIREAILVMGLLPYLDAGTSVILATINRLFYIISEIILVMFASLTPAQRTKEDVSS